MTAGSDPHAPGRVSRVARNGVVVASLAVTTWLSVRTVQAVRGAQMPAWTLARASGFTSYALMWCLVALGIVLSHPALRGVTRRRQLLVLRVHVILTVFTVAFTALHVVVLAMDPWSHVGWGGALLPMASDYRPIPVTLGVVALWAALLTAVTAALAGRMLGRAWWPVHKVAVVVFGLTWAHGVFAGSDTSEFVKVYLISAGVLLVLAVSRYTARTPADLMAEKPQAQPMTSERTSR